MVGKRVAEVKLLQHVGGCYFHLNLPSPLLPSVAIGDLSSVTAKFNH